MHVGDDVSVTSSTKISHWGDDVSLQSSTKTLHGGSTLCTDDGSMGQQSISSVSSESKQCVADCSFDLCRPPMSDVIDSVLNAPPQQQILGPISTIAHVQQRPVQHPAHVGSSSDLPPGIVNEQHRVSGESSTRALWVPKLFELTENTFMQVLLLTVLVQNGSGNESGDKTGIVFDLTPINNFGACRRMFMPNTITNTSNKYESGIHSVVVTCLLMLLAKPPTAPHWILIISTSAPILQDAVVASVRRA